MRWTDARIRAVLGAEEHGAGHGEGRAGGTEYQRIWTDSRSIEPADLFVALSGDRFDGHAFLESVRERGVRGAVVRRGTRPLTGLRLYPVDDPLRALGQLARARRSEISGPVVAITGTNGKTSTKEMVTAVLRARYRVHATRANLNNLIGVPLTILEAGPEIDALVVEAGANLPGEIARYRDIIDPAITVITNVAAGHLEGFGSLAGVLAEKIELARGVKLAVVGADDPILAERAREVASRVVSAGLDNAEIAPDRLELREGRARLAIEGQEFTLSQLGLHQAKNALLAWAVGRELALEPSEIAEALQSVHLPAGRGQLVQQGTVTILDDCYNANPASFRAAIATARALRGDRPLIFVAGTMLELGPETDRFHREIAAELVALGPDLLAGVGRFQDALEAHRADLGARLVVASDAPAMAALLKDRVPDGSLVVLKGSRGMALERLLPVLRAGGTS